MRQRSVTSRNLIVFVVLLSAIVDGCTETDLDFEDDLPGRSRSSRSSDDGGTDDGKGGRDTNEGVDSGAPVDTDTPVDSGASLDSGTPTDASTRDATVGDAGGPASECNDYEPNDKTPIDLDGNGAVDTFSKFSSLGSLIFEVWSGAPFWGEPLWTGYYVFGHGPEGEDAE